MYTMFIFVKINTKERINHQTKINKHFLAIICCICHSSYMLMLASWQPTRNIIWKSSSFLKRRWSAIQHLECSRPANIASCYEGIAKFSWGDVMEWIFSQIKYVNPYCFLFNSPYLSHIELKWSWFPLKVLKFISFCHLARMYWATPMNQMQPFIS